MAAPKYKNPANSSGILENLYKDPDQRDLVKLRQLIKQKLQDPQFQKKAASIISEIIKKDHHKS